MAEEIVGEASLLAIRRLDQLHEADRFDAWLQRIVRNAVRRHFRRQDRSLSRAVYLRWVRDFLDAYRPDLEALVCRENRPASANHALLERITADVTRHSYGQLMRISYDGDDNAVLDAVKQWLRSFVGVETVPLYERDDAGDWLEVEVGADEAAEARVLSREFAREVNARLAELPPEYRRLLRWYYLEQLPVPVIARLERANERTIYRRLKRGAAALRARLLRDGYFAERRPAPERAGGER